MLKTCIYTCLICNAFSYDREFIICSFLQDFSKGKGSNLQLICNAHTAFLHSGAELGGCQGEVVNQKQKIYKADMLFLRTCVFRRIYARNISREPTLWIFSILKTIHTLCTFIHCYIYEGTFCVRSISFTKCTGLLSDNFTSPNALYATFCLYKIHRPTLMMSLVLTWKLKTKLDVKFVNRSQILLCGFSMDFKMSTTGTLTLASQN